MPQRFAFDETKSGKDVDVYVIDSGIDITNPEFQGRATRGISLVEHEPDSFDTTGHGTHVAGIPDSFPCKHRADWKQAVWCSKKCQLDCGGYHSTLRRWRNCTFPSRCCICPATSQTNATALNNSCVYPFLYYLIRFLSD